MECYISKKSSLNLSRSVADSCTTFLCERESGLCRGRDDDERRDLRALSLLLRTEMESRSLVNFWALASASLPLVSSFCSRQPRSLARLAGEEGKRYSQLYNIPVNCLLLKAWAVTKGLGRVQIRVAHLVSGIRSCC